MASNNIDTLDTSKDYSKKLSNPQWQRKRLEIMQRDNFTCQYCGKQDRILHIHHKIYEKEKQPWEYEPKDLITLCDQCHKNITDDKNSLYGAFIQTRDAFRRFGFSDAILYSILNHLESFFDTIHLNDNILNIIDDAVLGTQFYDDIKTLGKLGIMHDELVKLTYPELLQDYYKNIR